MGVREGRGRVACVRAFPQEIKGRLEDRNEVREVCLEIRGRKNALNNIQDAELAEPENARARHPGRWFEPGQAPAGTE